MAEILLLGIPYEGRANFQRGASLAPALIRRALEGLELTCRLTGKPVGNLTDLGDLTLYPADPTPQALEEALRHRLPELKPTQHLIALGGDHWITYPLVRRHLDLYPDLVLLHLDAHLDRRDVFEGERENHATVIRRIEDLIGPERVFTLGYRTIGEGEEPRGFPKRVLEPLRFLFPHFRGRPVYLSLDLDVLDPGLFPPVSNPEPGGISLQELLEALGLLSALHVVGADLVEFVPAGALDLTWATVAALILRELICILGVHAVRSGRHGGQAGEETTHDGL